ncbi:MAG: hypothetical protein ACRBB4_05020 [Neptuniibacter sp.]
MPANTETQYKDKTFNFWMPGEFRTKLDRVSKARGLNLTQTILGLIDVANAELVETSQQAEG